MGGLSTIIQCPSPALHPGSQGIARVSVNDAAAQIMVTFQVPITLPQESYLFSPLSYSLTGGQRIFPRILSATAFPLTSPPVQGGQAVLLTLDKIGDFSIYTLTITGSDIDPFFSTVKLRFRLACDDAFDCRTSTSPAAPLQELPVAIDYLAKDYSSFRQALLDFIPTRLPGWTERSEADIGMMLLELLSATADNLSYTQDRVANESFLSTATQRRSVAAHLALLGYQMDEGASAYTWLQFQVNAVQILPGSPGFKVTNTPATSTDPVIVFETLAPARLDPALNRMTLFNWGNVNCCLPSTSLSAVLSGSFLQLKPGDYLLFDNGSGFRDVVRLVAPPQIMPAPLVTSPPLLSSPPASPPSSPPTSPPSAFATVVNWSPATPLQHDYCLNTTVVRGNLVPATHGETVSETLRSLTSQQIIQVNNEIANRQPSQKPPRQRLKLSNAPLAHLDPITVALGQPLQTPSPSPADVMMRSQRNISTLALQVDGVPWQETHDLLNRLPDDLVFRLEIDDQGDATVVFGDGVFGQRPSETSTVTATYRVGGGAIGNIGTDSLTFVPAQSPIPWLISVTNPLPAIGGRDLESSDHARQVAPATFHRPLIAVTVTDYEDAAKAFVDANGQPLIQRANASFLWSGSWLTVTLTVDPFGPQGLTSDLRQGLLNFLATKRLAGYDLQINGPSYVPVDLRIEFVAVAGSQPANVQQAVLQALSNGTLPGGALGFFHPDNFSFGDNLHISKIYSAVMAVEGVKSAQITRLARAHAAKPDSKTFVNLAQGFLAVGLDEVVRLDNDRNFPQNGTLSVSAIGVSV